MGIHELCNRLRTALSQRLVQERQCALTITVDAIVLLDCARQIHRRVDGEAQQSFKFPKQRQSPLGLELQGASDIVEVDALLPLLGHHPGGAAGHLVDPRLRVLAVGTDHHHRADRALLLAHRIVHPQRQIEGLTSERVHFALVQLTQ